MSSGANTVAGGKPDALEVRRAAAAEALLVSHDLNVRYGGVQALTDVNVSVLQGELVTVIGANGAGKSSLVNSIVGVVPKAGGRVEFAGHDITAAIPEELVGQGVANVGAALFGGTAQFVVAWLIDATGLRTVPAWYVIASSLVMLWAIWMIPETGKREPLRA